MSYNPSISPIQQINDGCLIQRTRWCTITFFASDAVYVCYAVGWTTGTVVNKGDTETLITPVYEDHVENKGILHRPLDITMMEEVMLE